MMVLGVYVFVSVNSVRMPCRPRDRWLCGLADGPFELRVGLGLLCLTRPSWWVRRGLKSRVWLGVSACACGDRAVKNFL